MSTQKKESKSLNKIHRRPNVQIQKTFQCTEQKCEKAYASYAALYTHIKNKHANAKLPQMKQQTNFLGKGKTGKKGRPQAKQYLSTLKQSSNQNQKQVQCRLCGSSDCVCVEQFSDKQKNKTISIMANEDFVLFVNQVGNLNIEDKFTWVRNTEDQFQFLTQSQVEGWIGEFNKTFKEQLKLSSKLILGEEFIEGTLFFIICAKGKENEKINCINVGKARRRRGAGPRIRWKICKFFEMHRDQQRIILAIMESDQNDMNNFLFTISI